VESIIGRELLKVSRVAEMFDVDAQTVYGWIDKGILPSVRIGRTIRIDADELRRTMKGLPSSSAIEVRPDLGAKK
jgi:excisionase family DNA binding protein